MSEHDGYFGEDVVAHGRFPASSPWDGRPFTHESTRHVSVWQKPSSR